MPSKTDSVIGPRVGKRRMMLEPSPAPPVIGRDVELQRIDAFLDSAAEGAALVLCGDIGIGKSTLLERAIDGAVERGWRVLRGEGVEFERHVPYATLNQLVAPLSRELDRLEPALRNALRSAVGLRRGQPPTRLALVNATLSLLRASAMVSPTLLAIDDMHWVDRSSAEVVGSVAHLLRGNRIGLIGATRLDAGVFVDQTDLARLDIAALGRSPAEALLRSRYPSLDGDRLESVLDRAAGNPLALVEFGAAALQSDGGGGSASTRSRVRSIYSARVRRMPQRARRPLLIAALAGRAELSQLAAHGIALGDLVPAERAGLLRLTGGAEPVVFRHPLIRSVVVESATPEEQRNAHRLLAAALPHDPARRAAHLMESAIEPDEQVAAQLESAARDRARLGDIVGGIDTLLHAAGLTPDPRERSSRLAQAAFLGADVAGDLDAAARLLGDARSIDPDSGGALPAAITTAQLLLQSVGDADGAHRVLAAALEGADSTRVSSDVLADALFTLALVCHMGGREELFGPYAEAARKLESRMPTEVRLLRTAYTTPASVTPADLENLDRALDGMVADRDVTRVIRAAIAAFYTDRLPRCRTALQAVRRDGQQGRNVAAAIAASIMLAFDAWHTGEWSHAEELASEGVAWCDAEGYELYGWTGKYALALLAAARGEDDAALDIADAMTRWAEPRGVLMLVNFAGHVRVLVAAGRQNATAALRSSAAISPPGLLRPHVPTALWVARDLVEGALGTGDSVSAVAHARTLETLRVPDISPRHDLVTLTCTALTADDGSAARYYERALAVAGGQRWPFEYARSALAYGRHLRRIGSPDAARPHLRAALDRFGKLGAEPWVAQAERAMSGNPSGDASVPAGDRLTAREREIAELAATGLSNKQIAARLHLSPRTVSSHLYQAFPKLGVTVRAALRDALRGGE